MTRDEAKKKWCPMSFHQNRPGMNRFDGVPANEPQSLRCVADDCMMWRDLPDGHCGLAGMPYQAPATAPTVEWSMPQTTGDPLPQQPTTISETPKRETLHLKK